MKIGEILKVFDGAVSVQRRATDFIVYIGDDNSRYEEGFTPREALEKLQIRYGPSNKFSEIKIPTGMPPELTEELLDLPAILKYFQVEGGHVYEVEAGNPEESDNVWGRRLCSCLSTPTQLNVAVAQVRFVSWGVVVSHKKASSW